MQLFRSALVVSLSLLSVSANALSGVYKCPGLKDDLEAKDVAEKADSITIEPEMADWGDFEENGIQYKNHYRSSRSDYPGAKYIFIKVNKNKDVVRVGVHQPSEMIECEHIPA
ncbi:BgTH12-05523 [Blumeria graminis f. sp. triticale]|uniref:BgTH12-05523 n=1 Tax=Blumeria graminis f. sp. triticale TaxID=1689686 RepID=A0A9W4D3R2_BLUGR|nr:BgTH12-05523 [Blumeria graminis f. sp. triticale]